MGEIMCEFQSGIFPKATEVKPTYCTKCIEQAREYDVACDLHRSTLPPEECAPPSERYPSDEWFVFTMLEKVIGE